jgi:hypothetical protein
VASIGFVSNLYLNLTQQHHQSELNACQVPRLANSHTFASYVSGNAVATRPARPRLKRVAAVINGDLCALHAPHE